MRLTLWYGTALASVLVVFGVILYGALAKALREQVDRSLEETAAVAERSLEEHRFGPFLLYEDLSQDFPELATLDKFFQIFGPTGQITIQSPNIKSREIPLSRTAFDAALTGRTTFESTRFSGEPPIRLISVPVRHGGTLVNIVRVGTSLQPLEETLHRLLMILLITVPLALLASLGGGWFLAGRALRPVETITQAAERIAGGDLTQRLSVSMAQDEIGRLAGTFNAMIGRLEASFQQVRQFTSDASHELRTPLTVLKGETELALRRPRSADDYRLVLESSLEEVDRMSRIVDELLFLSRADLGEIKMESRPVRLDHLFDDLKRQAEVLGHEQAVHIVTGLSEPVTIAGDDMRLRELLLNLLDNAIKYSPRGGRVEMSLVKRDSAARLSISDQGIGMSREEQTHIFDRFYRTDAARAYTKKGTGLGLAICKWIVDAHHGTIDVQSEPGKGSVFTVTLPLLALSD
ncbi:MAG TPA: heavy metal sensor histidine kinase [Nitrospiraceae bacterium]|nr:heavy metal sensor histidine kinase [Nitrospiraceae bacterium]